MKNRRFSDAKIMGILRQAESGVPVTELCREHGMSNASFYKWRSKFGGMDASMMAEMKSMAEENRRLKRMRLWLPNCRRGFVDARGHALEPIFPAYTDTKHLIQ